LPHALKSVASQVPGNASGVPFGDFIEAALVTAAQGKNVCVVVFARAAGGHYVMGKGGTNARDLLAVMEIPMPERQTAMPRSACFEAHGLSVIRIVHGLFRPGTLVVDRISRRFKIFSNRFFDGESGVIGTNGDAAAGRRFRS